MEFVRSIPVEDAIGAAFIVLEFKRWSYLTRVSYFELENGVAVEPLDENVFAIKATGEPLMRV